MMNKPMCLPENGKSWLGYRLGGLAKLLGATLLMFVFTGTTLAIEQPPGTAPQQRAWLVSHLVTDMQSVGSFTSADTAQMVTLVNSLTDDQVGLLARFYYLTREKTEQDAQLYATEQTESGDALAQAQTQVADVLAQLQGQVQQTYADLATLNPACETLCQVAYASVPGWCAYNQYAIPAAYYSGGCYVGPLYAASYCGPYATAVYHAFYNRASHYNYWNYQGFIHNNLVRIGHAVHYSPVGAGRPVARPAVRHSGAATVNHHAAVKRVKAPAVAVRHAPAALARHNAAKVRGRVAVAHARAPHAAHAAVHARAPHVAHAAVHAQARHVAVAHSGGRRR
jgi:hypothetical protein